LSHPTVHRIVKVLIEEGAVEQDPRSRRYLIGPEIGLLGLARTSRFPIRAIAEPYLHSLGHEVGDTVFLSVRHGADSVCIQRTLGSHPIQVLSIEIGARRPLGASVSGVAILSCLDAHRAGSVTQGNEVRLARLGFGIGDVLDRVEQARRLGYAYSTAGVMKGTRAVAVPVHDERGGLLAAISIAALSDRLQPDRVDAVVGLMQDHARMITRRHAEVERARRR
ncbi:MAG: IclR family transcriptional regulator, partial [Caldimonas sp.]